MSDSTAAEIHQQSFRLETQAALALGRFMLEFSRLEMNLGLCLAWANGGEKLESVSTELNRETFGARLERLTSEASRRFDEQPQASRAYQEWYEAACAIRDVRNQWIHGRWGIQGSARLASNVFGLPTSKCQHSVEYSISEMNAVVSKVIELSRSLERLRTQWPL